MFSTLLAPPIFCEVSATGFKDVVLLLCHLFKFSKITSCRSWDNGHMLDVLPANYIFTNQMPNFGHTFINLSKIRLTITVCN
jgi:hypothetical protein